MEPVVYLDTHVVLWLYANPGAQAFSAPALDAIREADDLRISPMVRLELRYLLEIGRIVVEPGEMLDELTAVLGLRVCDAPFPAVVRAAEDHGWTRDPFDRMIVAQASMHDAPLVTRDEGIRAHYPRALW